jgi:predicted enzyme related to lactoylglutathione lyase
VARLRILAVEEEEEEETMDKVVHFEIPVDDAERARGFYGSVFEWGLQPMEGYDYTLAFTTPVDETSQEPTEPGAINGGLRSRTAETPTPILVIQVDSIDESLKKVEAQGGTTVAPRAEMPGMGAYAYLKDTEGNVIGLWETT